jgi:hypothetical protein
VGRVTRCVFEKYTQSYAQIFFCQNQYITFAVEKVSKKLGYSCKKLPKVKIHPMGENSPNPVTLDVGECNV